MEPEFLNPKIVEKLWGREVWIVNNENYCGKILEFRKDHYSSLHYHNEKMETWYVLNGKIILEYVQNQVPVLKTLESGSIVHLNPKTTHKVTAITDASIIEVSTTHHDDDTIRILPSGNIGYKK